MPPTGYLASQASNIISATITAGDPAQAKIYLSQIIANVNSEQPELEKELRPLLAASEILVGTQDHPSLKERPHEPPNLAATVAAYSDLSGPILTHDSSAAALRRALVEQGSAAVHMVPPLPKAIEERLLKSTDRHPDAAAYWQTVVANLVMRLPTAIPANANQASEFELKILSMATAIEEHFKCSGFEASVLIRLALNVTETNATPGRRLAWLTQAYHKSSNDAGRVAVLRAMAMTYASSAQFEQGKRVLKELSSSIQDSESIKSMKLIDAEFQREALARSQKEKLLQRYVDTQKSNGTAEFLREALAHARSTNGPKEAEESIAILLNKVESAVNCSTNAAIQFVSFKREVLHHAANRDKIRSINYPLRYHLGGYYFVGL